MERSSGKGAMAKDTVIYMLAKGCEGVVGVLTVSAMSRIYVPEQMGIYSTVNIAVTTIAMFACQWLVQSVMRYINKYEMSGRLKEFYSTAFFSWVRVNLAIIFLAAVFLLFITNSGSGFLEAYSMPVLVSAGFMFITYSAAQLVIAMLAAVRRAKTNLFLSVVNICGKLVLLVVLNRLFGSRVEFIFISYCLLDLFSTVFGVYKLDMFKYIDRRGFDKEVFADLFAYGFPLMGNLITTQILNKSDVYIITFFQGKGAAGIYSTNYSLVSSAFTMLSAAVMRGSYPTILRTWSEGRKEQAGLLVNEAVRMYLILGVPAVCGVFALQDVISGVLFAAEYHSGNIIMGPVALGMMFLAVTEYSIKGWELNAMTKQIFYRSLIGGAVNVVINLIFVPVFGIITAAVSTFLGFFVYFLLARFGTRKLLRFRLPLKTYIRIIGSGLLMWLVLIIIKNILPRNIIALGAMVIFGIIIYFGTLVLSGEVKEELQTLLKKKGRSV
ncbi:MAG: oligosaccharide flippase family protein [Clostridiales bacterium]|nr:oligosaccharide flippase family protein [Clostridiales bacterium]